MAAPPSSDTGDDEILISARIHARLLGLGLLTLDARVTVGPLDGRGALPVSGRLRRARRRRLRGRRRRRVTPLGPVVHGGREDGRRPVGDGLARSEDLVGQATALLAEVSDR